MKKRYKNKIELKELNNIKIEKAYVINNEIELGLFSNNIKDYLKTKYIDLKKESWYDINISQRIDVFESKYFNINTITITMEYISDIKIIKLPPKIFRFIVIDTGDVNYSEPIQINIKDMCKNIQIYTI